MRNVHRPRKARNKLLTADYLDTRESGCHGKGFKTPKWIVFSRVLMRRGFVVYLYEAQFTVSKYLNVTKRAKSFKVRFSDHAPIPEREAAKDCDFFVGHTNFGKTNTNDALRALLIYFGEFGEGAEQEAEETTEQREALLSARVAAQFDDLTKQECPF